MKAMHTATDDTDELLRAELAVEQSRAELNRIFLILLISV
jgi:hypothetical protein